MVISVTNSGNNLAGGDSQNGEPTALYVHVPFCRGKCLYCGFYSVPVGGFDVNRLISAMIRELDGYRLDSLRTAYIGGGSPSCLPENQLDRLVEAITARFGPPDEFSVEVNPAQITERQLARLRRMGVNRLSAGGQSFQAAELAFLGRGYPPGSIGQVVRAARQAGFDNVGLDLIFALPGTTLDTWRDNLSKAIDLGVQHLSAYSLTYEPGTPLYTDLQAGKIAPLDEETDRQMYELAIDMLDQSGIQQYEISNFAQAGFPCRHNLVYWANEPYIGIGPSAASYRHGQRTSNVADVTAYAATIEKGFSPIIQRDCLDNLQRACETAVLNLRRVAGIDFQRYQQQTGYDVRELFDEPIERYRKLGFLRVDDQSVCLARSARAIADSILCDFAAI